MEEWKLFLVFQLNHCVCALDDPSSHCECLHFPAAQHQAVRTWNRAVLTLNQPTNQPLLQINQINKLLNQPLCNRCPASGCSSPKRLQAQWCFVDSGRRQLGPMFLDRLRKWKAPPSASMRTSLFLHGRKPESPIERLVAQTSSSSPPMFYLVFLFL